MGQRKLNWIKSVAAGAYGFIGSAFIVNGMSCFSSQSEYNLPHILLPLFNLLGNIGFAIILLFLGTSLILYALNRWRKYVAEAGTFVVFITFSMVLFISINMLSDITFEENERHFTAETDMQHAEQAQKIENMERPEFSNVEVTLFFLSFESLLDRYRKHLNNNDDSALDRDYESYNEMTQKVPKLLTTLSSNEKFLFSQYYAKLQVEWSDAVRQ